MTNKKSTKRALLLSALSLLMCVSMLVGSTFAWFTDSVTSGQNTIQSGNLDVELYYTYDADVAADEDSGDWIRVTKNTDVFGYNLWEPGYTKVAYFKVVNEGSLELKYQLAADVYEEKAGVNQTGAEFLLSDYIKTALVKVGATRDEILAMDGTPLKNSYDMSKGSLAANDTAVVGLAIWMPTTVGNVANHDGKTVPEITFGINLLATQKDKESDSFGDDYDKNAWHPDMTVYNAADLQAALTNGGKIELGANVELTEAVVVPAGVEVTLNLNGKTISGNSTKDAGALLVNNGTLSLYGGKMANGEVNGGAVIGNKGTLTLDGVTVQGAPIATGGYPEYAIQTSGTLVIEEGTSVSSDRGAISIDGDGSTTINGGVFTANDINQTLTSHVVDLSDDVTGNHTLTINGGTFQHLDEQTSGGVVICNRTKNTIYVTGGNFSGGNYYGNDNLSDYGYGGTFSVTGGTFDAKPATKYIADGFKAVDNGNGTYTVIPAQVDGNDLNLLAGYPGLYTDGTNYYVYDAQGLISMRDFWAANWLANNMWGRSYNVMADIDATGYTWNNVWVNVGYNGNEGFVFDGHGKTITGLTINDGLFSGTPNGSDKPDVPGYVKDITFDGVKVTGDHFAGVLWSNVYNDLVVENVNVINSTITGKCNVAALVGGTVIEYPAHDATVKFIDCVVENNVITAEGKDGQDPNGANVYLSRAYGNTTVIFENCVDEGNTVTNKNGLVGGGIYGYTTWTNDGFAGTGTCDTFAKWNGISVVTESTNAALADAIESGASQVVMPAGEYKMPSSNTTAEVNISGTKDTVLDVTLGAYMDSAENVTITGVTIKTSTGKANGNGSDYAALYAKNVTYVDCVFVGPMRVGRDGAKFVNCTFTELGNDYVWTYGNDVTFEGCTFNTDGKAILIYSDGGNEVSQVSVKNCVFISTQGAKAGAINNQNCAAIEIHNYGNGVNLVTEGNSYDSNFSGEWRIKTYENGKTKVFVNGTEYTTIAIDGKTMTIDANKNVTVNQ